MVYKGKLPVGSRGTGARFQLAFRHVALQPDSHAAAAKACQHPRTCRARCYAETCFHKFLTNNLQRLRRLAEADLTRELAGLKLNLRQGFVCTSMGDLQTMLSLAEAKKRKADIESHSRKQPKLLQAQQPRVTDHDV